MTPERIAELRAMLAAATPGEWQVEGSCVYVLGEDGCNRTWFIVNSSRDVGYREHDLTVALFASAPSALPEALDCIEALRARVAELERERGELEHAAAAQAERARELRDECERLREQRDEWARQCNMASEHQADTSNEAQEQRQRAEAALARVRELREALETLGPREHTVGCGWYGYKTAARPGGECECGSVQHNARVEAVLLRLERGY